MWRDYTAITPQAERIHRLLTQRGEILCNDHIALRTFGAPAIGLTALAQPFEALGWRAGDHHCYADKPLRACAWRPPGPGMPQLVISELVVGELSPTAQAVIDGLLAQLPATGEAWATAGRPWQLSHAAYEALAAESEYAAWVAAFGARVHHIAVDVASLSTFPDLAALTAFLIEHGFALDPAEPARPGSPSQHLEQVRTRVDAVTVGFTEISARIPSCYYEFARRCR